MIVRNGLKTARQNAGDGAGKFVTPLKRFEELTGISVASKLVPWCKQCGYWRRTRVVGPNKCRVRDDLGSGTAHCLDLKQGLCGEKRKDHKDYVEILAWQALCHGPWWTSFGISC